MVMWILCVCECVCMQKCWHYVEVVRWGGGVVITRPSHQWESQFPFKRALCSSLPSFPPHSSPTPSASVTLLFSECHLYDFYSSFLAILVSLSLSLLPQNAPKPFILMLSWMLFVHHTRVFFLFFECAESSSLFLRSSRLATEKCRACKGGGWKNVKTRQKAEWQNRWEWNRSACLNVRWQEPDCSPSRQRKGSEFWVLPL